MRLDRNSTEPRRGKYALLLLRDLDIPQELGVSEKIDTAIAVLEEHGIIDYGADGDTDFFVIRLKDKYAAPALAAYAMAAYADDQEYAMEVLNLSKQAAEHPNKHQPD